MAVAKKRVEMHEQTEIDCLEREKKKGGEHLRPER
jgi:hypothetical protein